jgi:probable rRNA maturation factor
MTIDISVSDPAWKTVKDLRKLAKAAIAAGLEGRDGGVSVLLTDDAAMQALNLRWRGKDRPTNVLSFPSSAPAIAGDVPHLGDIALGFGVIAREAEEQKKPLHHHISHLLVHGCLHLLGYDHETEDEAQSMETREIAILESLGVANPYQ